MKDNYLIRLEDLVNNPTPRVPICLCLDTSGSMAAVEGACETTGETIYQDGRTWNVATGGIRRVDELQKGVEKFYEAIRARILFQFVFSLSSCQHLKIF